MTNLDDKLMQLWFVHHGDANPKVAAIAIAQIKQAFADEGYGKKIKMLNPANHVVWKLDNDTSNSFMTGQEWHDRFLKEYRVLSPKSYSKDQYAKMAAKKAAGLK